MQYFSPKFFDSLFRTFFYNSTSSSFYNITTFFTTRATKLVLILKKTFKNVFLLFWYLFLVLFSTYSIDDELLWEPTEWGVVQSLIFFIFLFSLIAENLVVNHYGSYAGRDECVWFSRYKTFWLIGTWFVLSFGVATLFVIVPFYYKVNYLTCFTFSWWNWYSKVFFFKFLIIYTWVLFLAYLLQINLKWFNWKKILNLFTSSYPKRYFLHNLAIILIIIFFFYHFPHSETSLTKTLLFPSPTASTGGTSKSCIDTIMYTQRGQQSLILLDTANILDTVIQRHPFTRGHPTTFIDSAPLISSRQNQTIVVHWTHNIYGTPIEQLLKINPEAFRSPYMNIAQSIEINTAQYPGYEPNFVLDNYRSDVFPNLGSIFNFNPDPSKLRDFDTSGKDVKADDILGVVTVYDMIFHLQRYPLLFGERTETYHELFRLIFSGPNAFKPYDPDNAIRQHLWEASKSTLDEYLRLACMNNLEPKDFNLIFPPDVVEKSNFDTHS